MDTIVLWEEEIAMQEEAAIYNFYGDPINEGVGDALKSFVDKIRKALLALIDKIDEMIGEAGNSKFKSFLKSALSKAKSCLSKTNNVSSKEEAKEIAKEASDIKDEVRGLSPEFKKAVEENDLLEMRLLIKNMILLDLSGAAPDRMCKYAIDHGIDLFVEDDGKGKPITDKDSYNTAIVELVHNFSKKRYNEAKRGARAVFGDESDKKEDEYEGVSDIFKKTVEDKNLIRIRVMIKDNMLYDKTFKEADNMCRYAIKHGIDLFEEDDGYGREAITDEDSYNTAAIEFMSNFSKARYNELKRGIKYVFVDKKSGTDEDPDDVYI